MSLNEFLKQVASLNKALYRISDAPRLNGQCQVEVSDSDGNYIGNLRQNEPEYVVTRSGEKIQVSRLLDPSQPPPLPVVKLKPVDGGTGAGKEETVASNTQHASGHERAVLGNAIQWPLFSPGKLESWPPLVPPRAEISTEMKKWASDGQQTFAGYLGILKPKEPSVVGNGQSKVLELTTSKADGGTTLTCVKGAFGTDTVFVSSDPSSQPFNPSTWPTLTKQALKECSGNGWWVDRMTGCIHVDEDPGKAKFVTSRFYNKLRQDICYAYSCKPEASAEIPRHQPNIDDLIWEPDEKESAVSLSKYGYSTAVPKSLPTTMTSLRLGDRNSKIIMTTKDKTWKLGVAQFNVGNEIVVSADDTGSDKQYLVAKGAANLYTHVTKIPEGKQYHSKTPIRFNPIGGLAINGIRLDSIFFEHGKLCIRTEGLARTTDSFEHARMWTLTREPDDSAKKYSLSLLDIGVRSPSTPERDIGYTNHPEPAYNAEVATVKAVRCFVALVPDALDSDLESVGPLNNVVNLQDIHPVKEELHIIYLLHRTGRYYTHHVYNNVKLVDVDLSQPELAKRFESSIETWVKENGLESDETEFADLDEVDVSRGCGLNVNGGNDPVYLMRGYYNEFWKRVIDPSRAGTAEQIEMFRRWQPFFGHDFTGRHYLTEPLNNFEPHEVHVVKMADYLRECGSTFHNTVTGGSFNQFSRVFLSGTGNDKQSWIGSPSVQTECSMVQVKVPDKRIKCVIYDFEGVETLETKYYKGDSERQALVYFRQTLDVKNKVRNPERVVFPDIAFPEIQREKARSMIKEVDIIDGQNKGYKMNYRNKDIIVDFDGLITEQGFYFVNCADTEHIKIGAANLPFNLRVFTVNCRQMCEKFIYDANAAVAACYRKWPAVSGGIELPRYQIYGSVWDDSREEVGQVVGVLGGKKELQVASSSFFYRQSPSDDRKHLIAFVSKSHPNNLVIQHDGLPEQLQQVASLGLHQSTSQPGVDMNRGVDMNHVIRAMAAPVFDLCKGYPVQGFYRMVKLDCEAVTGDPIREILRDNSQTLTTKIRKKFKPKTPKGPPLTDTSGGSGGGNPGNPNTVSKKQKACVLSSLSIMLAAHIIFSFPFS
ncbi:hypothetical protein HDE_03476 [Halotydeus destructor]|nr:hypothetical protein HDE_03476 [Halotydeus destructor]